MDIKKLISKAINGDQTALEGIVNSIQDNVYYLSLRMLANPDDAKDATQEIKTEIKKSAEKKGIDTDSISKEIDKVKDDIDDLTGSMKRNL